jgi:hypothetical protein
MQHRKLLYVSQTQLRVPSSAHVYATTVPRELFPVALALSSHTVLFCPTPITSRSSIPRKVQYLGRLQPVQAGFSLSPPFVILIHAQVMMICT